MNLQPLHSRFLPWPGVGRERAYLSRLLKFSALFYTTILAGCSPAPVLWPDPGQSPPPPPVPSLSPPMPPGIVAPAIQSARAAAITPASPRISLLPMQTIQIAWDTYTNGQIDGFKLYAGHRSGQYQTNALLPVTNGVTATVDQTAPVFMALTAYVNTRDPSNNILESPFSNEIFFMPSNAPPFCMITNGKPVVIGFGKSNHVYTVTAGQLGSITNQVAVFQGTNAVWTYFDPAMGRTRFYRVSTN